MKKQRIKSAETMRLEKFDTLPEEVSDDQISMLRVRSKNHKDLRRIIEEEFEEAGITVLATSDSFRDRPYTLKGFFRWMQANSILKEKYPIAKRVNDKVWARVVDASILYLKEGKQMDITLRRHYDEVDTDRIYQSLYQNLMR